MGEAVLYLKLKTKVKTKETEIRVEDLGSIYCTKRQLGEIIKKIKIYQFSPKDKERCVIGVLKVVEGIQKRFPDMDIQIVGETETIVERVKKESETKYGKIQKAVKIGVISTICCLGTMYTIMAYHNDIGLPDIFEGVYTTLLGEETKGSGILEIAYSLGLSIGIMVFYNHVGKRRLTPDPSPVEVEMRTYEADVNMSIIETASREEKIIDID